MGWWIALAILVGLAILPLGVSVKYNADGIYLAIIGGPVRIRILPAKKKEKKPKKEKPPREDKAPAAQKPAEQEPAPPPQEEAEKDKKPAKKKKSKKTGKKPAPAEPPARKVPAEPPAIPPEEKYPDLGRTPATVKKEPVPPAEPEPENGGSWKDFLTLIPIVLDFLGDFRRKLRVNRLELKMILAGDDPCDLALNYGRAWTALGNLLPQLERVLVIQKRDLEVECDFTASETKIRARLDLTITLGRLLAAVFKFAIRALIEYLKIMNKRKGGAVK